MSGPGAWGLGEGGVCLLEQGGKHGQVRSRGGSGGAGRLRFCRSSWLFAAAAACGFHRLGMKLLILMKLLMLRPCHALQDTNGAKGGGFTDGPGGGGQEPGGGHCRRRAQEQALKPPSRPGQLAEPGTCWADFNYPLMAVPGSIFEASWWLVASGVLCSLRGALCRIFAR